MKPKILLFIALLLLALPLVTAEIWSWDMANMTQNKAQWISFMNTSSIVSFSEQKVYVSPTVLLQVKGDSTVPAWVSQVTTTLSMDSTYKFADIPLTLKMAANGAGSVITGTLPSQQAAKANLICQEDNTGAVGSRAIYGFGSGGTCTNFYGGWDGGTANMASCITGGACYGTYTALFRDSINYWFGVFADTATGGVTLWNGTHVQTNTGTACSATQMKALLDTTHDNYCALIQILPANMGVNFTANVTQWRKGMINFTSASATFIPIAMGGSGTTFNISCNNGTTWTSTTNNSVVTCPDLVNEISLQTFGNFSAVYVDSGVVSITPLNITFTATDLYDASSITNFSVGMYQGGTLQHNFTTTNGTIPVSNITNGFYNLTFQSPQAGGYFPQQYFNVNVSGNSFVAQLYQAILQVNASEIITGTIITNFFAATRLQTNQSNSSGYANFFLKAGSYNITGNKTGYFNTTNLITIGALTTNYTTLTFGTNQLKIAAKDIFGSHPISTFTVLLEGRNVTYSSSSSTTNGNVTFSLTQGNYTATLTSATHETKQANFTVSPLSSLQNETVFLYPINSIYTQIFHTGTSTLITPNPITLTFSSTSYSANFTTTNGTLLVQSLTPEDYTISVSSSGFATTNYYVTLSSSSSVQLNAYLSNSSSLAAITFNVRDQGSANLLPNMLISISQRVNLSYTTITQKLTDISGQAQFSLDQSQTYRFTISGSGYDTRTFDLQPIQTEYTITLTPTSAIDYTTIYNQVSYVTYPISEQLSNPTSLTNFSIITASESGIAINYFCVNTTYLGIEYVNNISGSPAGGTALIQLNLSNLTSNQIINIGYCISLDGYPTTYIYRSFYVDLTQASNESLQTIEDNITLSTPLKGLLGLALVVVVMATMASMGLRDRRLNVVGGFSVMAMAYFGFFNLVYSSAVAIILIGSYFIGGIKDNE